MKCKYCLYVNIVLFAVMATPLAGYALGAALGS